MTDVSWASEILGQKKLDTASQQLLRTIEHCRSISRDELEAGLEYANNQRMLALDSGVKSGAVIIARNSDNPAHREAQAIIDEMLGMHQDILPKKVDLYVHVGHVDGLNGVGGYAHNGAINQFPQLMETSQIAIEGFCGDKNKLRSLFAHELGHTANHDNTISGLADFLTQNPSHLREIRASQMGAIIHGKPMKYAESFATFQQAEGSITHPSTSQLRQQTYAWARFLEKQDCIGGGGEIVKLEKALSIFRSVCSVSMKSGISKML